MWRKQHENMDPSCRLATVQAGGGVVVRGIFTWYTLGPLVDRPSLYGHSVPSSNSYFQQDNAPRDKAHITSNWFHRCAADRAALCYCVNMDQHLRGMFPTPG